MTPDRSDLHTLNGEARNLTGPLVDGVVIRVHCTEVLNVNAVASVVQHGAIALDFRGRLRRITAVGTQRLFADVHYRARHDVELGGRQFRLRRHTRRSRDFHTDGEFLAREVPVVPSGVAILVIVCLADLDCGTTRDPRPIAGVPRCLRLGIRPQRVLGRAITILIPHVERIQSRHFPGVVAWYVIVNRGEEGVE